VRIKQVAREQRERELGLKQQALPNKRYGVIVADPEWDDEPWSRESGTGRHPMNHYPTSSPETIKSRPVETVAAKDCVLFLWATNQHLRIAISVLEAWGFEYVSNYVWGKPSAGTGRWNRSRHEILLVGIRGNPPCPAPGEQWESLIMAPRGEQHSAKPECFLEMIEQYFPTLPKIELNRRGPPRLGWDAWGLEAQPASAPLDLSTTASPPGDIIGDMPEF
jgi:N6-adenosine-specific RNA methylase IME4